MPNERQIYLLNPLELPPETIAVAFAKTSRSPQSFRQIAAELTDEKSSEFHEKWVVGYGHASVAEHAVLHIAVENISRLAVESLESSRLASYTEKSTRYQKWGVNDFFTPPELRNSPHLQLYLDTCRLLMETYHSALPAVREVVSTYFPRETNESESSWERRIRSEYVDVCRFLLPAACLANVGVTMNARNLEHSLNKMLSHPLEEVRQIGDEMKQAALGQAPTLVKYVAPNPYLIQTRQYFEPIGQVIPTSLEQQNEWCRLVSHDSHSETRILAGVLYRHGQASFAEILSYVEGLSESERCALARALMQPLGKFDIPLRELEHSSFTFDLILDQGAYFELKRHRMMTQTPQPLTADLGYAVPRLIAEAGIESEYRKAMEIARLTYTKLRESAPGIEAYVVPNGFNRRVLLTFNLRSADHLVSLRAAPSAHFSIRRVARRIAEEIQKCAPLLGCYLRVPPGETWQQVEQMYFIQIA
jgi:thymidylate synthase ThyX